MRSLEGQVVSALSCEVLVIWNRILVHELLLISFAKCHAVVTKSSRWYKNWAIFSRLNLRKFFSYPLTTLLHKLLQFSTQLGPIAMESRHYSLHHFLEIIHKLSELCTIFTKTHITWYLIIRFWTSSLTLENKFIFHTVWKEKNAAHVDSGLSSLVVNVFTAYFIIVSKIKNSSSSSAEILSIPLYKLSQHWCRFPWTPIPLSLDLNPEKIGFLNRELTQRDGRGKKTANLVWQAWQ